MKTELMKHPGSSVSEAARRYGVSRSAYYKYEDAVRPHIGQDAAARITLRLQLQDAPGVLSGLLTSIANVGANVLTVEQQAPTNGSAVVAVCLEAERLSLPPDLFAKQIGKIHGVQRILDIEQEGGSAR